jgi:hypothetical protein
MTNQPTPLTGFKGLDAVIEEVHDPETANALPEAEVSITALDDLRKKLCDRPPLPQKSKWRFW